ncbi:MAG: iron-sulfur cluster assembly scaffold protein, partial [Planctomycetes bacterium]|nr:iron-sulfur cluster assembly scaffold protein [Planctomycetota bacterium]
MTPAELLDDHQRRPRNLGKLPAASAIGDVGSIVAGDALRLYLSIDGDRITQARFQVFNCQPQVAATSLVTELITGRDLASARTLGVRDVCAQLGGLDSTLLPPQLWGLEALRSALDAWETRDPAFDREADALLCRCYGVAEETVRQAIAIAALTTVEAVGAA